MIIMEPWQWNDSAPVRKWTRGWSGPVAVGEGPFVCIELKVWPNEPTSAQREFLKDAANHQALTAVCYTMDEVMSICDHVRPLNGRRLR